MPLNEQRRLFAHEWVKDHNTTRAAKDAGFSPRSAHVLGCRLLKDPDVWGLIQELSDVLLDSAFADAGRVLDEMTNHAFFDPADAYEDDGSLKRITDIPENIRRCIIGIETVELFDGSGDGKHCYGLLKKVKWVDRAQARQDLAKYHSLLKEKVEHSGSIQVIKASSEDEKI